MRDRCEFRWFGQDWECIRGKLDDADDGGECDNAGKRIMIDAEQDQEDFLTILHHELTEGATYLVGCLYGRGYPDKRDIYVMTHTEMDVISTSIRGAYEDIKAKMLEPKPKREGNHRTPTRKKSQKGRSQGRKRR